MKIRDNYTSTPRSNVSSFYGEVHHDAKEVDRSWVNLYISHSMEAIFGILKRSVCENDADKENIK